MSRRLVVVVLVVLVLVGQQMLRSGPAEIRFEPAPGHEVVLLATSWCGYCAQTRAFLERNGVAYVEHDVEQSAEGEARWQRYGRPGVPILVVDGDPILGFDPEAMAEALMRPAP